MLDQIVILENILSNTESGSDYKNFILVSKTWYSILNKLFPEGGHFVNHLTTLLKLFPDKNWAYSSLIHNPNITYDYMLSNPKFNRKLIMEYITYNPNIFDNQKIMEIINSDLAEYAGDLSYNRKLPFILVIENPEINWSYPEISYNEVDIEFIKNNLNKNWDWSALSANKSITWDVIDNNRDLPWDYDHVLENPNITIEIILNNPNVFINPKFFLRNPNAYKSWNITKISIPIDHNMLAMHAPWDIIKEYPDLINTEWFKYNMNMPCHMAIEYAIEGYFEYVKLPTEFIRSIVNIKTYRLSGCTTLTWRIAADNPDADWDFVKMSYNHFNKK